MLGSPCSPCCGQCKPTQLLQRVEIDVDAVEEVVQSPRFRSVPYYEPTIESGGFFGFNAGNAWTVTYYQPAFTSGTYSLTGALDVPTSTYTFSNDFFRCEVAATLNGGFVATVSATYMQLQRERWIAPFGQWPPSPTLEQFKQRWKQAYYILDGVVYPSTHEWGLGPGQFPAGVIFGGVLATRGGIPGYEETGSSVATTVRCAAGTAVSSVVSVVQLPYTALVAPASILPINGGLGDFAGFQQPFNTPKSLRIAGAYVGPGTPSLTAYSEVRSELRKRISITGMRGYDFANNVVPLF